VLEEVRVGGTAATTLALIVHELATNSIKYGALSATSGTLDVSCAAHDDEVVIVWAVFLCQQFRSAAAPIFIVRDAALAPLLSALPRLDASILLAASAQSPMRKLEPTRNSTK
jgi:hypothetical protein